MYSWICKNEKCKKLIDIIRTFDGHRDPPDEEEGGPCQEGEHAWEKKIHVPLMTKGASWGAGKGHWIYLLAIGAASLLAGCVPSPQQLASSVTEIETQNAWCYVLITSHAESFSCVPKAAQ